MLNKIYLSKFAKPSILLLTYALFYSLGTPTKAALEEASLPSNTLTKASLYTDLTWGSSLKDTAREDFSTDTALNLLPSYRISESSSVKAGISIRRGLERTTLPPIFLGLRQKIARSEKYGPLDFSVESRIYLPVDEERRKQTSFRGRLYIRPMLKWKLSHNFKYTFRPSYSENFHQFETFNGVVNNQRTLSITSALEIQIVEKMALNTLFGINERWNYQGSLRETYLLDLSLGLTLSNKSSLALGYGIETNTQTSTGKNNIKLYDNEQGSAYFTWAYLL